MQPHYNTCGLRDEILVRFASSKTSPTLERIQPVPVTVDGSATLVLV